MKNPFKKHSIKISQNESTRAQVLEIQLSTIVKYCANMLQTGCVSNTEVKKIQKLFDIVNKK